jgi:GDP-4-dehydro-6-deoxy-D-mannose reductase
MSVPSALLLTGASGFVGSRFLARVSAGETLLPPGVHIHALSRSAPNRMPSRHPGGVTFHACDLTDADATQRTLLSLSPAPTGVLHLAGLANPRVAQTHPFHAREANAGATRNLLAGLADRGKPARVLIASTAAVYGKAAALESGYIPEGTRAQAQSAYGWSKRLAERVARACYAPNLEIVIARPYNHAGPGQGLGYVLPDLVSELKEARRDGRPMRTGSLWPERDLLHVDDVLDAYLLLLEKGLHGRTYDISSGNAVPIQTLLEGLVERIGEPIGYEVNDAMTRSGEAIRIAGDATSLRALGWAPRFSLSDILDSVV